MVDRKAIILAKLGLIETLIHLGGIGGMRINGTNLGNDKNNQII